MATSSYHHQRSQRVPVAVLWAGEQSLLLPLPTHGYLACVSHLRKANVYSQIELDTNHYSVPVTAANRPLVVQAYAFQVRILADQQVVAEHVRCFGREQDIVEPLHYLPLLEQRPGPFAYALPIRRWRQQWPVEYEQMLEGLRQRWPDGRGVCEFIAILKLHQAYPAKQVALASQVAIALDTLHYDGVLLCLRQQLHQSALPHP